VARFNPNRLIEVEVINDDRSGAGGLKLWTEDRVGTPRQIARGVEDGEVRDMLTERQVSAYDRGEYRFKVRAEQLLRRFDFLYG
jgi:hypothetical protein